jgi:hypothetical protein
VGTEEGEQICLGGVEVGPYECCGLVCVAAVEEA